MIVVSIIGLLAAIAIPNFIRSRTTAQTNASTLFPYTTLFRSQQWALEMKTAAVVPAYTDISGYLKNSVICPAGGTKFSDSYALANVSGPEKPTCISTGGKAANGHEVPIDTVN